MSEFLRSFAGSLARAVAATVLFAVLSGAATQPVYRYDYTAAVTR